MNTWDERKRHRTLAERGLDFADAHKVFAGNHVTRLDDRRDYSEPRCITAGYLKGRFVVITWTPRDGKQRIISLRYGHDQEESRFQSKMGRSR